MATSALFPPPIRAPIQTIRSLVTCKSDVILLLQPGDEIMADKEFTVSTPILSQEVIHDEDLMVDVKNHQNLAGVE